MISLMFRCFSCVLLLLALLTAPALAEKGKLRERLTPAVMAIVYPGAERLGLEEGSPPAIAVYQGDKVVAYVFSTLDIVAAVGYSATPFDVIGGVDLNGRITGAKVIAHNEPYILNDQRREQLLDTFLAREAGRPVRGGSSGMLAPDFVAGATVSARAMRAALTETARLVLRTRSPREAVTVPTLDAESFNLKSWQELFAAGCDGAPTSDLWRGCGGARQGGNSAAALDVPLGKPDDLYVEFMTGLFTPRSIGGSLVGLQNFEEYKQRMPVGGWAIIVASNGPYDFLGTKYFREAEGRRFDRLRVVQGRQTFDFVQADFQRIGTGRGEGIRGQQDAGLFALAANSGFDPVQPWRLELLVNGSGSVSIPFGLDYKIPDGTCSDAGVSRRLPRGSRHGAMPPERCVARRAAVGADADFHVPGDAGALSPCAPAGAQRISGSSYSSGSAGPPVRSSRSSMSSTIPRRRSTLRYRLLSRRAADRHHRRLHAALGAADRARRVLRLAVPVRRAAGAARPDSRARSACRNGTRPLALEKRLWMGKYIAAAAVLVLVMTEIDPRAPRTEIEPFKTAITSKFTRAWPYVLYAGALLAIGLFSERAYCRFLCPLGGVLAFLDRLHLLNLLKRRPECGNPCHLCERVVPGAGDRADRQDRHGGMLPVPRLPGRILRRSALPAAGARRQAARRGSACCRHG